MKVTKLCPNLGLQVCYQKHSKQEMSKGKK